MPSTQLNIKLGTDNSIFTHDVPINLDRSSFNISRKRNFCIEPGAIVPVDLIETLPNDTFEISVDYLIKSQALQVAPFTNYKIRTHWYYCRLLDLWEGAPTLITKGRSGNLDLTVPKVYPWLKRYFRSDNNSPVYTYFDSPESLTAYLGLAPDSYFDIETYSESTLGRRPTDPFYSATSTLDVYDDDDWTFNVRNESVSLLPYMMYQKIYRMAYTVPNLLQGNKIWFPDDLTNGWRINYAKSNIEEGTQLSGIFVANGYKQGARPDYKSHISPQTSDNCVDLLALRYGLFEDDVFTTALPWQQRGTAPTIRLDDFTIPSRNVYGFGDVVVHDDDEVSTPYPLLTLKPSYDGSDVTFIYNSSSSNIMGSGNLVVRDTVGDDPHIFNSSVEKAVQSRYNLTIPSSTVSNTSRISLNDFRSLIALSVWQERNARTQGDYNATIYAHFDSSPKVPDFEPIYIGGTSDVINFGEVVQTSQSTSSSPQGTLTGLASSQNGGSVGYFRSPDFGYIMGVMIIQPETYYATGIEKFWKRFTSEDFFTPEEQGLGLEEVTKGELSFITDDTSDLFGYNERNTEYKTRRNQAIG